VAAGVDGLCAKRQLVLVLDKKHRTGGHPYPGGVGHSLEKRPEIILAVYAVCDYFCGGKFMDIPAMGKRQFQIAAILVFGIGNTDGVVAGENT